jgi:excisionase family DNA binding protein
MTEGSALPDLLTVEEAAARLRIGRTKAYAMTREWRATGGRSGLPVIDVGRLLRVPRQALEGLLGIELSQPVDRVVTSADACEGDVDPDVPAPESATSRPRRGRKRPSPDQPRLFDLPPKV